MKSGATLLATFCLAYGSYNLDHNWVYFDESAIDAEQFSPSNNILVVPATCYSDAGDLIFFSTVRYCNEKQHDWYKL